MVTTLSSCYFRKPLWRYVCKPLWRGAKSCATKQGPSSVEGAEAGARLTQTTLQAAPSVPPVIAVIARRLPSAQATFISSEEAVMYETAAAVVASSAV